MTTGRMSDEVADLIVDLQLARSEGDLFGGVERTAASTSPTRQEDFLPCRRTRG